MTIRVGIMGYGNLGRGVECALKQNPDEPDPVGTDFFKTAESYGKCEVILYSPQHTVTLPDLSDAHVGKLVDLWCERSFSRWTPSTGADIPFNHLSVFAQNGHLVEQPPVQEGEDAVV